MISSDAIDLADLRRTWEERRAAMRTILGRFDMRGMKRPARDPDERGWLAARGEEQIDEDAAMGEAARAYYATKYQR